MKALTLLAGASLVLLAGCGGGGDAQAPLAQAQSAPTLTAQMLEAGRAQLAQPAFHLAPVQLAAPGDADAAGASMSAQQAPHREAVTAAAAAMSTARLLPSQITAGRLATVQSLRTAQGATAQGTTPFVTVYTPAQIRAAYGLDPAPAPGAVVSSYDAPSFGAGQTIYIVDAYHDPNIVAELAAFNAAFGLPGCTVAPIAPTAALPLTRTNLSKGCNLSVVYANSGGGMTATPSTYNASWAMETALDVQWAHAMAPLANIVLIEAPDASIVSLGFAANLAGRMGPGVVSMSWATGESSLTGLFDVLLAGNSTTFVAASGDSGTAVNWPASSAKVVAVGGTTLNWSANSPRIETVWSGSGGGISAFTPLQSWQTRVTVTSGAGGARQALKMRGVGEVALNADPYTGEYVAVIASGTSAVAWYSLGGTSSASPQWASLLAITNAMRASDGKPLLGDGHATLYNVYANPTIYSAIFFDVTAGNNGSCITCTATSGYDLPTGLGTPKSAAMMTRMLSWF